LNAAWWRACTLPRVPSVVKKLVRLLRPKGARNSRPTTSSHHVSWRRSHPAVDGAGQGGRRRRRAVSWGAGLANGALLLRGAQGPAARVPARMLLLPAPPIDHRAPPRAHGPTMAELVMKLARASARPNEPRGSIHLRPGRLRRSGGTYGPRKEDTPASAKLKGALNQDAPEQVLR
jgi:hypothetical protein